jgi:transcriptional antiterminator
MNSSYIVKKIVNNNVVIASRQPLNDEVVLVGKGIGFKKFRGESIDPSPVEKLFVLKNEKEQDQYKKLLPFIDEKTIGVMSDVIHFITNRLGNQLDEQILISLTDHISFALKRLKEGLEIKNPFLLETKTLYPEEYKTAADVVIIINESLQVNFPEGEIGFIALHIHSAISKRELTEVNQYSQLIHSMVDVIEHSLKTSIDRESIHYIRLVRHIRFMIDRIKAGEVVEVSKNLAKTLQVEYPLCYNLAWKLIKIMQKQLQLKVYDAEAIYLTLHLQRLSAKIEQPTS